MTTIVLIIIALALLPAALYVLTWLVVGSVYILYYVGVPVVIIGLLIAAVHHASTFY